MIPITIRPFLPLNVNRSVRQILSKSGKVVKVPAVVMVVRVIWQWNSTPTYFRETKISREHSLLKISLHFPHTTVTVVKEAKEDTTVVKEAKEDTTVAKEAKEAKVAKEDTTVVKEAKEVKEMTVTVPKEAKGAKVAKEDTTSVDTTVVTETREPRMSTSSIV